MKRLIVSVIIFCLIIVVTLGVIAVKKQNSMEPELTESDIEMVVTNTMSETTELIRDEAESRETLTTYDESNMYVLFTSYGDFTITDGKEYAVIKDCKVAEGNLPIECWEDAIEDEDMHLFKIVALDEGECYSITPQGVSYYKTEMYYGGAENGFYVASDSDTAGVITVSSTGTIHTEFNEKADCELFLSDEREETPWSGVTILGNDEKITMEMSNENVVVKSENPSIIEIVLETDFNRLKIEQIETDSDGVEITCNEERDCFIWKKGEQIYSKNFGYSVIFSGYQYPIERLYNVEEGTLLMAPEDQPREGYEFIGWFKESSCENEWDFERDRVAGDLFLYAGWKETENEGGREIEDASNLYELYTDYGDFTITDGSKSAVIKDCQVIEGDMLINPVGPEMGHNADFLFEIPILKEGQLYTITPRHAISYGTKIQYSDAENGFFVSLDFDKDGVITISSTGAFDVEFDEKAAFSCVFSESNEVTPWYCITVQGLNKKATVNVGQEKTIVKTADSCKLDIVLEDDLNKLVMEQIETDSEGIEITGDEEGDCSVWKSGEQIYREVFGY